MNKFLVLEGKKIWKCSYRRFSSTACKQYCLAAGATQGNIAYTQTVKLSKNLSLFLNTLVVNNLALIY
jgi:hypothetical protein